MTRLALAATVVLASAGTAAAQPWFGPGYGPGFGGGFAYRSHFAAGPGGFRAGWWYSQNFYAAPVMPYTSIGWWPLYGPGYGPGYGNPFFLPPPGGAYPFPSPPVFVVPPPIVVLGGGGNAGANLAPAGGIPAKVVPPVGSKPGDYIVISPKGITNAAGGTITPMIDRVATPEPPRPKPIFNPFVVQPAKANTDRPEADPAAESARQVRLARAAFAAEEYGLAADHLGRAAKGKPDDAVPFFLRAQARFAAGQYADAVADIGVGMKLASDWPAGGFKLKELYGANPERFDVQLADLRKAVAANPDDAALAFLLGYELWFGGDRPAAAKLFADAARRAPGNAMIERFVKAAEKK